MTIDELAVKYGWYMWGGCLIYPKANGEFYLTKDEFSFTCACCGRKTVIKTDLSATQIKNIIKTLGEDNE